MMALNWALGKYTSSTACLASTVFWLCTFLSCVGPLTTPGIKYMLMVTIFIVARFDSMKKEAPVRQTYSSFNELHDVNTLVKTWWR